MLSFRGRCFTYDKSADGYLRGEADGDYDNRDGRRPPSGTQELQILEACECFSTHHAILSMKDEGT